MSIENNLRVTTKFYKNQCLPAITWNKKIIEPIYTNKIHTVKRFFAVIITFEGFCVVTFLRERESKKKLVVCFSQQNFLWICREDMTRKLLFMKSKFIFWHLDIRFFKKATLL